MASDDEKPFSRNKSPLTASQKFPLRQIVSDLLSIKGIVYSLLFTGLLLLVIQRPNAALEIQNTNNYDDMADKNTKSDSAVPFARLSTLECSKADAERPDIQYALIIDAGSTGSRIHVYRFNYCKGKQPTLEDEVFEPIKPGLSSFTDPMAASESIDPLLSIALANVPKELYGCTPVTVKATAGLRMLGGDLSQQILQSIEQRLRDKFPFHVVPTKGVVIMDGSDEGVYAWITVNYLLGRIGGSDKLDTAAILDLGGGSTQIVFEPTIQLPDGEHRVDLNFSGHQYSLYQHSYDGYGLMQGRKKIVANSPQSQSPCLSPGKQVSQDSSTAASIISGISSGIEACRQFIAKHLFDKSEATCVAKAKTEQLKQCSFDGIYMPSLTQSFSTNDMYAFSYFYDMYAEPFQNTKSFTVGDLKQAADTVCKAKASSEFQMPKLQKMFDKNDHWCLDLGFMYYLLNTGYDLPDNRRINTAKKIDGIETGWSLGAAIQILDGMMSNGIDGVCKS